MEGLNSKIIEKLKFSNTIRNKKLKEQINARPTENNGKVNCNFFPTDLIQSALLLLSEVVPPTGRENIFRRSSF